MESSAKNQLVKISAKHLPKFETTFLGLKGATGKNKRQRRGCLLVFHMLSP